MIAAVASAQCRVASHSASFNIDQRRFNWFVDEGEQYGAGVLDMVYETFALMRKGCSGICENASCAFASHWFQGGPLPLGHNLDNVHPAIMLARQADLLCALGEPFQAKAWFERAPWIALCVF